MAKGFDQGVQRYTVANLDINVYFPEEEVMCGWCPFLTHSESLDRDSCRVTGQTLYSRKTVGYGCPLTILNTISAEDRKEE